MIVGRDLERRDAFLDNYPKFSKVPHIYILSEKGELIQSQNVETYGKHPDKVIEFLNKNWENEDKEVKKRKAYQNAIKIGTIEAYQKFLKQYENDSSAKFQVRLIKKRIQKLND